MLDFGMPTLIELENINECVDLCVELGLQFIEINMNMPDYLPERLDVQELKKACDKGIYFTFHLEENLNIADFNSTVTDAYLKTVAATIEIAKDLNSPVINMHMAEGVHFKLPHEKVYLFQRYNDFYLTALDKFKGLCDRLAYGSQVKICIENCGGFLPFMRQGIDFLLESDVFQITYDIGHCYCAGSADREFILTRSDKLFHMHIHDAKDDKNHLVLGTGNIDIEEKLDLAHSRKCRCVIETKSVSGLKDSIAYLRR